MKKVIHWVDENIEIFIGSVLLSLMVLFTTIQIGGRYLLAKPFPWTEELTRYMFVWMVYSAVGISAKQGKHIRITFLHSIFSKRAGIFLDIFSDLVFLGFGAFCFVAAYNLMGTIRLGGQLGSTVQMPMWILYLVMPLGFLSLIIRLIQSIIKSTKKLKELKTKGGEE